MVGQVCIGGPADGERVTVLHGSSFKWAGATTAAGDAIYRRETLAAPPGFSVDVWVLATLRPDEALAMLVDGYRQPRA